MTRFAFAWWGSLGVVMGLGISNAGLGRTASAAEAAAPGAAAEAVAPGAAAEAGAPAAAPMNVIVIVGDDHRWDSLRVAGNDVIHTPNLDALAAGGVRFTQARVTTSICMTSRASILTGQLMSRHGIDRFGKALSPEQFADTYHGQLRAAGYWTGFVGKYGVGGARPEDFDFLRSYEGRHWMERGGQRLHVTEFNRRDALEFLEQRPTDRPFLLSLSFFAPHAEDAAPQQYLPQDWSAEPYRDAVVPQSNLANEAALQSLPPFLADDANEGRVRYRWRFDTPERYQEYMIRYFRLITEVDAAIGDLMAMLRQQGIAERTLVVFIGDNGYFHADRGLADKWYPYEQALRVPLVIHDPRLPTPRRGLTRDELALNIDVAPTVLAACGVPIPPAMQGADLAPLYLAAEPPAWREEFFYEHPTITRRERIPGSIGLIRRDLKYVRWPEWEHEQLFDLRQDPDELTNLVDDPARAKLLAEMRQRLETLRQSSR